AADPGAPRPCRDSRDTRRHGARCLRANASTTSSRPRTRMSAFSVGLHGSLRRVQHPLLASGVCLGALLAILVALLERRLGPGAADRTLTGITFGLALPLAGLGVVARTCRTLRLDQAFSELARHGADRRALAL